MATPLGEHEASKVHFSDGVGLNTEINVQAKSPSRVDVHVGFLIVSSTYEIKISVPHSVSGDISLKETGRHFELISSEAMASPVCGHGLKLKVTTKNEGKLKDKLTFYDSNDIEKVRGLEVNIVANVIDKLRGTPMLKDGIRCIGTHQHNDSGNDTD